MDELEISIRGKIALEVAKRRRETLELMTTDSPFNEGRSVGTSEGYYDALEIIWGGFLPKDYCLECGSSPPCMDHEWGWRSLDG